ncbi:MAG: hypothetical protein H6815_09020 [Phycisphaeraceae bacterium]|nr:hypothetical protein [Phycisphaerales bacterium]MCB9860580.1 hypothetical protein [Phycisphaeraceae bacterium]
MRHHLSFAVAALVATGALGDPITFTHSGTAAGTLDNVAFPESAFTITATGQTNRRIDLPFNAGWFVHHDWAQIEIDGLGTYTFTTPTRTFVNNDLAIVGFSRAGPLPFDLFNGPGNNVLASWEMLTSIELLTGTGHTLQWSLLGAPNIVTSAGILRLTDSASVATFGATVIPSPSTCAMLATGSIVLCRRRRKVHSS